MLSKSPRSSTVSRRESSSNCARSIDCLPIGCSSLFGMTIYFVAGAGLTGWGRLGCGLCGNCRIEGLEETPKIEVEGLWQAPRAVAGLIVETGLRANHPADRR